MKSNFIHSEAYKVKNIEICGIGICKSVKSKMSGQGCQGYHERGLDGPTKIGILTRHPAIVEQAVTWGAWNRSIL